MNPLSIIDVENITGFRAVPVRTRSGTSIARIETPFSFHDGHPITFYAEREDGVIHFYDDGATLFTLSLMGFDLNDRRRLKPIRAAAERFNIGLEGDGNLHALARVDVASIGFSRMCSALLSIRDWAKEAADLPADATWLAEEVGLYLLAWKPKSDLRREVETVGVSGQRHKFDFELDGEFIDAVVPKTISSATTLRKIVDVRGLETRSVQSSRFLVILDDRRRPDLAAIEAKILGNVADTWPLTRLIERAGVDINQAAS